MKVPLGGLGARSMKACEQCFSVPNMDLDLTLAVKVQVSPLPISVLITQTAVTY